MQYTGTKTVEAKPMTRLAYNDYRNWLMPLNENGSDEGYLVEYLDGGKGNDSRHYGYISWSPKDVFERSYKAVEAPRYAEPHQERVYLEAKELQTKLDALRTFALTSKFEELSAPAQADLATQNSCMYQYLEVLKQRINRF